MKYGQKIRSFSFDRTGLEKATFMKFNRFIMVIKNLRLLSVEFNNVGNEGIKVLLESLRNSPTLLHLNISENLLTNEIIPTLASFISENKGIESLECERNVFGDSAVDPISKALSTTQGSKLRVFRFGAFRDSAINFENVFKLVFSNSPAMAVGSITANRKTNSEYIFNHNPVVSAHAEKQVHVRAEELSARQAQHEQPEPHQVLLQRAGAARHHELLRPAEPLPAQNRVVRRDLLRKRELQVLQNLDQGQNRRPILQVRRERAQRVAAGALPHRPRHRHLQRGRHGRALLPDPLAPALRKREFRRRHEDHPQGDPHRRPAALPQPAEGRTRRQHVHRER